ncbi:Protein STICHEL [Linum perenne]
MAAELRVGDPSSLHLRKELTQIRKASRVLRDPPATTTSSSTYKSPLPLPSSSSSPRSAPPLPSDPIARPVFLHNWKIPHNHSLNPDAPSDFYYPQEDNSLDDGGDDDSLDDSRSDTHLSSSTATASNILRCRDAASLVSPSITLKKKHRGKKSVPLSDVLSRYQQHRRHHPNPNNNFTPLLRTNRHPSLGSVDHYSDYTTDDYTLSEDLLRKFSSSASPLLSKLKHKNWSRSPSTFIRKSTLKDQDSSYSYNTPALSTSSYNRYYNRNPSTVGSWDATTTTSLNDRDNNDDYDDDDDHLDHLPGSTGCGIPCYWSKRASSCCSPSLSDTLRRRGRRILCGSQSIDCPRLPFPGSPWNWENISSQDFQISQAPRSGSSHFQIFLIDECHLLPSKLWLAFLKFLEEPPQRVVFIFITTDPDNVPRTVQSRCQKYLFNKIKDGDIISRLRNISTEENLDVESDALDLIALNADGSLRDAETMLDQLSLLGKKITTSLVNELVGVVSDEKLLELLELALLSDTAETVKRARDLMDSGVDPMVLMSQLASLIMDIIAGTGRWGNSFFGGRSLTEAEVGRLKSSLKLLSEAEKQLQFSSDRSTWFTATLLQLGSVPSLEITHSSSSKRGSSRTTEEDPSSASREVTACRRKSDPHFLQRRSSSPASLYNAINGSSCHLDDCELNGKSPHRLMGARSSSNSQDESMSGDTPSQLRDSEKLDIIWEKCIEKCHSKTLRQLLHSHGKLLSIAELEGVLAVYIAFFDEEIKARAERFMSSITNSIEMVLRRNVEVKIILVSGGDLLLNGSFESGLRGGKSSETCLTDKQERKANHSNALDRYLESKHKVGDHSKSSTMLDGTVQSDALSPELLPEASAEDSGLKETAGEMPMQRIESIIREQRLETAWLQAAEKGTPGTLSRLKPEKNQVLPQEGIYHHQSQKEFSNSTGLSPHQWEDELNHELKVLKMQDAKVVIKDQIGRRAGHNPMSPSMLHDSSFTAMSNKESTAGYESSTAGRGCSRLFCWNTQKSQRGKVGKPIARSRRRVGGFSLFGECGKQNKSEKTGRRR